jgi:hypothetical protein
MILLDEIVNDDDYSDEPFGIDEIANCFDR